MIWLIIDWYDALVLDSIWFCHSKKVRIPGTEFFQTEKGMEEYTVVSVLKTDIRKFPFTKVDFPDEVSLKEYVERAKSQELFETGENVADCHTVLTLVTCAYEWDGARTVVIAVR